MTSSSVPRGATRKPLGRGATVGPRRNAVRTSKKEEALVMAIQHKLSPITWTAIALVVIGALNWGLIGLFRFDLVAAIFGQMSPLSRVVYTIVALAGVYLIADTARLREEPRITTDRSQPVVR
jgi:uncharacterized protein